MQPPPSLPLLCRPAFAFLFHAEISKKIGLSSSAHETGRVDREALELWRQKQSNCRQDNPTMLSRTAGILARRSAASAASRAAPKAVSSAVAARFQPPTAAGHHDFESTANLIGGGMWPSSSAASASSAVAGYHTSAGLMMPIKVVEVSFI